MNAGTIDALRLRIIKQFKA